MYNDNPDTSYPTRPGILTKADTDYCWGRAYCGVKHCNSTSVSVCSVTVEKISQLDIKFSWCTFSVQDADLNAVLCQLLLTWAALCKAYLEHCLFVCVNICSLFLDTMATQTLTGYIAVTEATELLFLIMCVTFFCNDVCLLATLWGNSHSPLFIVRGWSTSMFCLSVPAHC